MKKFFLPIISIAFLASCNLYKNYERPEVIDETVSGIYRDTTAMGGVLAEADTTNFGNMPWREVFTDAKLQVLIEKSLQNFDMQKADMNIEKAKSGLSVAKLAYIPSLVFAPSGELTSFDHAKTVKTYTLPISASWEIGSWGYLHNTHKWAKQSLLLAKAAKQATQTAMISAVANIYFTLQMFDEQLLTTTATIEIWKKNVETMEAMHEVGSATNAAVAQAKANYHNLLATIPTLQHSIRKAENALCVLLNEAPHAIERSRFDVSVMPQTMSAGVPLQLLSNRPDVKIAELNLSMAFYDVNVARSQFYPSIKISGVAGWTNSYGGIVNPGELLLNAAASLAQPIFMNGRLKANLKVEKLDYEAASLDFQKAILTAGEEVSNALSAYQTAMQQAHQRQQQVELLKVAAEETQLLFVHGNGTSYLETLTAQQSLLSAQMNYITDKYNQLVAGIDLYKALGGGRE
jgi:NodT family efflux transporter outer membrane factor (OMF) lipoprotein